jgi:hypothetical protein
MARKPVSSDVERNAPQPLTAPRVVLTLTQAESGQVQVRVGIAEFIAYSQNTGFTRLNLTGGKVLDVKETTDQIDRLVRLASCQPSRFAIGENAGESTGERPGE